MSNARRTLEKARFFLAQAERVGIENREQLQHFVEAAIVFGRSVTFHLQKEFSNSAGFKEWYEPQQAEMKGDPLFPFFLEKRNYILKEGPVPVQRTIAISVTEAILVTASAKARVVRGKPWYRRSPRILVNDLLRPARELVHEFKEERRRKLRLGETAQKTSSSVRDLLHFEDAEWREEPALDLMRRYFDRLERIVDEAESQFEAGENG